MYNTIDEIQAEINQLPVGEVISREAYEYCDWYFKQLTEPMTDHEQLIYDHYIDYILTDLERE